MDADLVVFEGKNIEVLGRKDAEKQEQTIDYEVLGSAVDDLVDLYERSRDAGAAFSTAVKSAAESSGLLSTTVRSYIAAVASGKVKERARRAHQLSLVFSELEPGSDEESIDEDEDTLDAA